MRTPPASGIAILKRLIVATATALGAVLGDQLYGGLEKLLSSSYFGAEGPPLSRSPSIWFDVLQVFILVVSVWLAPFLVRKVMGVDISPVAVAISVLVITGVLAMLNHSWHMETWLRHRILVHREVLDVLLYHWSSFVGSVSLGAFIGTFWRPVRLRLKSRAG